MFCLSKLGIVVLVRNRRFGQSLFWRGALECACLRCKRHKLAGVQDALGIERLLDLLYETVSLVEILEKAAQRRLRRAAGLRLEQRSSVSDRWPSQLVMDAHRAHAHLLLLGASDHLPTT